MSSHSGRKVYRWEICFSQSALGSVQPSFLSFPAYQISNITHDVTDNWHAYCLCQLKLRAGPACEKYRSRPEHPCTGSCQYWMQTRYCFHLLVSSFLAGQSWPNPACVRPLSSQCWPCSRQEIAGTRGDIVGRWRSYSCKMWPTLPKIKRA